MSTRILLKAALLAATALAGSGLIRPAAAQSAAQIQTIESQIKALQAELARVKADSAARDRALRAAQDQAAAAQAQASAAAAQQQALQVKLAELPVAAPTPAGPTLPLGTFRVGGVTVTLGGFTAGEAIYRSKNLASSIDTGFNSIPFRNSPNFNIPEYRNTAQQSRFSLLAQGRIDDAQTLSSYMETDFLSAGSSSNNNQSNSYTLRMRQFYGAYDNSDLGLHVIAGQAWSLATMYRVGLVPRQENVPLTIDAQYVVGFNWERQAQFRVAEDFLDHRVWAGISLEEPSTTFSSNPNCLTGGAAITAANGATIDDAFCGGANVNSTTTYSDSVAPDIIAKVAVDPGFGHYEAYGLLRFLSGRTSAAGTGKDYSATGEGIGGGMILPLVSKRLDFQLSGLFGQGIGRYATGQLPDATFNTAGKIEPIAEYSAMGGLVAHPAPNVDVYLYGGVEKADHKYFTSGTLSSGYGNPATSLTGCYSELGSCSASTDSLVEGTIGAWWRVLKGSYGTAQLGAQYEYVERNAFSGAGPTKGSALSPTTNENMFLVSVRYLPFQ